MVLQGMPCCRQGALLDWSAELHPVKLHVCTLQHCFRLGPAYRAPTCRSSTETARRAIAFMLRGLQKYRRGPVPVRQGGAAKRDAKSDLAVLWPISAQQLCCI